MKFLYFTVLSLVFYSTFAQSRLDSLDLSKIPQKKVQAYIHNQVDHDIKNIDDIKATCPTEKDSEGFWKHEKIYKVKKDIVSLWSTYFHADPNTAWNSNIVSLGLFLDKSNHEINYRGDRFTHIEMGQVYYLNLKLLKGLFNMATAFEVVNVDESNRTFEFSYVEYGGCKGRQKITLLENTDGTTSVVHSSFFYSGSKLRDKYLYPYFHAKCINKFHRKIKQLTKKDVYAQL